jgi:hypothetical protein
MKIYILFDKSPVFGMSTIGVYKHEQDAIKDKMQYECETDIEEHDVDM